MITMRRTSPRLLEDPRFNFPGDSAFFRLVFDRWFGFEIGNHIEGAGERKRLLFRRLSKFQALVFY